jgi:hypothetical protein
MDISCWSCEDVAKCFRQTLSIPENVIDMIVENEIDGEALLECTETDLKEELHINKLGHRYVFMCVHHMYALSIMSFMLAKRL